MEAPGIIWEKRSARRAYSNVNYQNVRNAPSKRPTFTAAAR